MNITILGSGSWGTALAQVASDNGHRVLIYGINPSEIDDIQLHHQNRAYFPDVLLPTPIRATSNLAEAVSDAEILVLAVPTVAVRSLCEALRPLLTNHPWMVNVSKGFDPFTGHTMSATIREVLPDEQRSEIVSLIGPSHAEEVILRLHTAVTAISRNLATAQVIQNAFATPYFRIYTGKDEVGAEFAVAAKNVIAVGAGIVYGLGYRDNTRAALITRGLAEIVRMGVRLGGQMETFLGLTGIGDLIVTCSSFHSRNFQAGLAIGTANDAKDFLTTNTKTVEGIRTAKVLHEAAEQLGLELPITTAVYRVLYEGMKPSETVDALMNRELTVEHPKMK